MIVLIGLSALCVTGCSVQREAVRSSEELRTTESRNVEARDSVVVAVHDTIMEVTTITIRTNETGDTLRVAQVTERERIRDRDAIAMQKTKTEIVRDTVYVERKDSVEIRSRPSVGGGQSGKTALNTTLRWVFWIIIALTGFVIVIKVFNILK